MQKRLIAIFTTICVALSLLSGMVFAGTAANAIPYAKDLGKEEYANYYTFFVADREDLETLADVVNGGDSLEGRTFLQTQDINLNEEPFTPIGNFDANAPFKGVYNGQKHTISNIAINLPEQNGVGLFGYAYNTTLKNIGIESGSVAGKNRAGGIAGYADSCIIMNCYNKADISLTSGADGVGGIAGVARPRTLNDSPYIPAKIYGCFNLGTIRTVSIGGSGIVGWSGNGDAIELHGCYSGGTIVDSGVITGTTPYYDTICRNRDRVTGDFSDNYYLAGICDDKYNEHNAVKITTLNPIQMAGILNRATGTDSRTFTVKDGQLAFSGKVGDVIGSVQQKVYRDGVLIEAGIYYYINDYAVPTTYDGSAVLHAVFEEETYQAGAKIAVDFLDQIVLHVEGDYPSVTEAETYPDSDIYTVGTADELAAMATLVNEGVTTFAGKTVCVTADLDFSGYETWTPIGILTSSSGGNAGTGDVAFCGVFDGQYHHFININFDQTECGKHQALFAYVEGGVLQNIILDEGSINAAATRPAVLAALLRNGTVQNIENHVSVYSSDTSETQNIGIVAATKNVNIIGCINYGTMGAVNSARQDNASFSGCGYDNNSDAFTNTKNCISVGPVNGIEVFPVSQRSTHENCYFLDDVFSVTPVSGQQTLSRARLLSGEAAWLLNTASGTQANAGLWANASYGPALDPDNAIYRITYTATDSDDQVLDARYVYAKWGNTLTYPEFTGYTVVGVDQGGVAISEDWVVSGDATLNLSLENKHYSIRYELNGGEFLQTPPDNYIYGKNQVLPGNSTVIKTDYCLLGWCDNAELTGKVYTAVPADLAKDVTYYAKWEQPKEISSPAELLEVSEDLGGFYILTQNIDLSETEFEAIGTLTMPFTGVFDGNGYTISGLTIHTNKNYQGLFGVNDGLIRNVTLAEDCEIYGNAYVGGIAGKNNGEIINCISHASVGFETTTEISSYKLLTQNVCQWGDNDYYSYGTKISEKTRRPGMLTRIHDANADILFFQEVSFTKTGNKWQAPPWSDYFAEHLPNLIDGRNYAIYGNARSYSETPAEGVQIAYDTNKFKVATDDAGNEIKGEFWLNEVDPTKELKYGTSTPNDTSDDASNFRMCTWMMLEDRGTGNLLAIYNVHLDLKEIVKVNGAGVVRDYINALKAEYPEAIFIAAGDFNCEIGTGAYNAIKNTDLENVRLLFNPTSSDITTHDGTMSNTVPATGGKAIDHILVSKDAVNVTAYERLTQVYDLNGVEVGYNDSGALRPSDHYGVTATISPISNLCIGGIAGENDGTVQRGIAQGTVIGNGKTGVAIGNNSGTVEAVYGKPTDTLAVIGGGDTAGAETMPEDAVKLAYDLNKQLNNATFTVENNTLALVGGRTVGVPVCITVNETDQYYAVSGTEFTVDATGLQDPYCTLDGEPIKGTTFVVPDRDCTVTLIDEPCFERHVYTPLNPTNHRVVCDTDEMHTKIVGHSYTQIDKKDSTCDEEGYLERKCTLCGYIDSKTYPALGHQWGRWKEEISATETPQVQYSRQCGVCQKIESRYEGDPLVTLHAEIDDENIVTLTAVLKDNPGFYVFDLLVEYDPAMLKMDAESRVTGNALNKLTHKMNIDEEGYEEGYIKLTCFDLHMKTDTSAGTLFTIKFKLLQSGQVNFLGTVSAHGCEGDDSISYTVPLLDYIQELHAHKYEWESVPEDYICECGRMQSTGVVDVDGDGHLTPTDATVIMRHVVNTPVPYMHMGGADYNKDGKISLGDAVTILRKLVE